MSTCWLRLVFVIIVLHNSVNHSAYLVVNAHCKPSSCLCIGHKRGLSFGLVDSALHLGALLLLVEGSAIPTTLMGLVECCMDVSQSPSGSLWSCGALDVLC